MPNEDTTEPAPHRFTDKARELAAKYPDVTLLEVPGHSEFDVLVRPPTRPEWRHSKIMLEDPKTRQEANAYVVNLCVLWPEPKGAEFMALAERYPAWVDRLSGQLAMLVGTDLQIVARKL